MTKIKNVQLVTTASGSHVLLFPPIEGTTDYEIGIETDPGHFAILRQITVNRKNGAFEIPSSPRDRSYCVRGVSGEETGDWSDLVFVPAASKTPGRKNGASSGSTEVVDDSPSRWSLLREILWRDWLPFMFVCFIIVALAIAGIMGWNAWVAHRSHHNNGHPVIGLVSGNVLPQNSATNTSPTAAAVHTNAVVVAPPARTFKNVPDRTVALPYNGYLAGSDIPESLVSDEDVVFTIADGWDLFPTMNCDDVQKCLISYDGHVLTDYDIAKVPLIEHITTFRVRSFDPTNTISWKFALAPKKDCLKTN